jgi:protein involved in polysaccharide export with SLBB domain
VRCIRRRAGLALAVLIVAGCASAPPAPRPAWLSAPAPREYLLEVGDVIDLKLFHHPELNELTMTVRPDGRISAQLVGDVEAAGRSPATLAGELTQLYRAQGLRDPAIAVILRKGAGLRVFVGGEVNTPGMIQHEGRLSLSRAIMQAGGVKTRAAHDTVIILRDPGRGPNVEPLAAKLDLREILDGRDDVLLQPYDVVIVPTSTISKLNDMVEQYVVKLIPITFSAGFSYSMGTFTSTTFD